MNISRTIGRQALLRWTAWAWLALGLAACGGGESAPTPPAPVPSPPVITQQPASQSVLAGQSATFSVVLADATGASYQWRRDGAAVADASLATFTLAAAQVADSGSRWSVQVSNAGGSVTSAQAELIVAPVPTPVPTGISALNSSVGHIAVGIAVDAEGNTLVARTEPAGTLRPVVVLKFAPDGTRLPFGPTGVGIPLPGEDSYNFVPTIVTGLALDGGGDMIVSTVSVGWDGRLGRPANGGSLWRITSTGAATQIANWPASFPGAVAPVAPAVSPDGSVYFVDYISGRLARWSAAGGLALFGNVRPPNGDMFADYPRSFVALDRSNTVYVFSNLALSKLAGGTLELVAGQPGRMWSGSRDGQGASATFEQPAGLVVNAAGNLYVADGSVLRKVTPGGLVTTVAGQLGVTTITIGALPGSIGTLRGLAIAPDGAMHALSFPPFFFRPDSPSPSPGLALLRIRVP
jgi:hypothetical protein